MEHEAEEYICYKDVFWTMLNVHMTFLELWAPPRADTGRISCYYWSKISVSLVKR